MSYIRHNFETEALENEIKSFGALEPGWRFGEGGPIGLGIIEQALSIVSLMRQCGFNDIDAFPGGGGEISLMASAEVYVMEVVIEADSSITVSHDCDGNQLGYMSGLRYADAVTEISNIAGKGWTASGYFTRGTTASSMAVGVPSLSEISGVAYPSLILNVYADTAPAFLITSGCTTTTSAPLLQFSGDLTQAHYQHQTD